jgi:hypothetical protein
LERRIHREFCWPWLRTLVSNFFLAGLLMTKWLGISFSWAWLWLVLLSLLDPQRSLSDEDI